MTLSKTHIFNITLNILGVSTPLENTNSDDNKAILLNNYYELARDFVLKDFDWNFASCISSLSMAPEQLSGNFKYTYIYPNDCVCARDIFEQDSYAIQKFSICALADEKKVILADTPRAVLRYTKRIEKEICFTPEFSMALAYYLASLTSSVIVGSIQKGELAYEKYRKLLKHAKILNAQEGIDSIYSEDTYLDARN